MSWFLRKARPERIDLKLQSSTSTVPSKENYHQVCLEGVKLVKLHPTTLCILKSLTWQLVSSLLVTRKLYWPLLVKVLWAADSLVATPYQSRSEAIWQEGRLWKRSSSNVAGKNEFPPGRESVSILFRLWYTKPLFAPLSRSCLCCPTGVDDILLWSSLWRYLIQVLFVVALKQEDRGICSFEWNVSLLGNKN